jgi:hypothetical protein
MRIKASYKHSPQTEMSATSRSRGLCQTPSLFLNYNQIAKGTTSLEQKNESFLPLTNRN